MLMALKYITYCLWKTAAFPSDRNAAREKFNMTSKGSILSKLTLQINASPLFLLITYAINRFYL